jgi:hypothetical protein
MIDGPEGMEYAVAEKQTRTGGDWFLWIAGFSVINSLISLMGAGIHFVVGLGTTELFDAFASHSGAGGKAAALAVDLLAAGFYVLYGLFARRGARWAFVTGMVFYALDGLLLLMVKDWLSVAFHAYALYRIFGGLQAAGRLGVLRARLAASAPPGSVPHPAAPGVWPPPPGA